MNPIKLIIGASLFSLISIGALSVFDRNAIDLFNQYRPIFLQGGGEQCLNTLQEKGVKFRLLGDQGSKGCPVLNAVLVEDFENTTPSSPFILSCPAALSLASWLNQEKIKSFSHMGTLNCRKMRGSNFLSEHSFGNAIDISKIDGISIIGNWGTNTEKAGRLQEVASNACEHFSNVLTPETNRAHQDHFHLDIGLGIGC